MAFEVIVSQGISEEKIAQNAIIDKIILELKDIVSDDAAWRYIKHLVALQLFKVQRIDTGYRQFNVLLITDRIIFIGRSFDAITNILKPQIDKWITSIGRERLCQLDKTVYLASIIDIKKNRWSYVFDMKYEELIRNIPIIEREEFDYE